MQAGRSSQGGGGERLAGTLALLCAIAVLPTARAQASRATPCSGAFIVRDGPLLPGAPAAHVDVIRLGGTPYTADLGIGCGPGELVGRVGTKATRRRTVVRVVWRNCAGLTGRVRLNGTIIDGCGKLRGTLRSKSVKRSFEALRSRCGDGVADIAAGEDCDLGSNCPDATPCPVDCHCATTTTTTTTTIPTVCNPLGVPTAQGCPTNQKCTWITLETTPTPLGRIGCAPAGNVALDGACTQGAPGAATGFDDCETGLICVGGTCADICGFDTSPGAACAAGSMCTAYAELFANGSDSPVAGACKLGCDPLTQLRSDNSPCPPGQGCYLLISQTSTVGTCAGAGTLGHGQQITGTVFANSCQPGHMPRRATPGTQTYECAALCRPTDVYQGNNVASEDGVSPYTCQSRGAAPPADPTAGESCRFLWALEPFSPQLSPYSNTVGWCFKHAVWQYDTNGDTTPDTPFPRCVALTTSDVVPPISSPPQSDAEFFWCTALAASTTRSASAPLLRATPEGRPKLLGNWR